MTALASSACLDPADGRDDTARALCDWIDLQRQLALYPQRVAPRLRLDPDPVAALRAEGFEPAPRAEREASLETLRRCGVVAVPLVSPSYPPRLASLVDAAPLLLVRGELGALARPCVAIVGARAATAYGRAVAGRLAGALAEAGAVVVSGLAAGIDAAAHRGALEAGGYTIAFQACGPDRVYPAVHRALAARIEERGALVSEFAPGTPALPHHFPLRNRLISGLATLVVVVEARVRSGSLVTARLAADQGRDVFAVPGPITSPVSEGPNRLLRDGAGVADGPEVILEELRRAGHLPPQAPKASEVGQMAERSRTASPKGAQRAASALGARSEATRAFGSGEASEVGQMAERNRILRALQDQPATRDELGRRLACPPEALALGLLELEMEGCIREDRDGRLRVVA